jgi:hypothetical protein
MERISEKQPGYDCIFAKCVHDPPCQTEPPGSARAADGKNHGIHAEEWHYTVMDDTVALRIKVFTDIYPETVPESNLTYLRDRPLNRRRHGAFMNLHHKATNGSGEECDLLGRCTCEDLGSMFPERFFNAHGDPAQFEQPDSFWEALEAELERLRI